MIFYYYNRVYLKEGLTNLNSHLPNKIKANFSEASVEVIILSWKGRNLRFNCTNLSKEIIPEESYTKQNNTGLIIFLKKLENEVWDRLDKEESDEEVEELEDDNLEIECDSLKKDTEMSIIII